MFFIKVFEVIIFLFSYFMLLVIFAQKFLMFFVKLFRLSYT